LRGGLRAVALALPALAVAQVGLGVWTVLSLKALPVVELHLGLGALLLVATVTLAVATRAPVDLRAYLALTKPRITVLSVVTAAVGLALAPAQVAPGIAFATLAGICFIVGSANTLNMYLERDVDGLMARTRRRPLPSGRISPEGALWFGIVQAAVGLPLLTFG